MSGHGHTMDSQVLPLVRKGFFSMAFQPILDLRQERVFGFEALLRGAKGTLLENPQLLFGAGGTLSRHALTEVDSTCFQAALRAGSRLPEPFLIFINLHGETLWKITKGRSAELFTLLESLQIPPGRLVLEISETTEVKHMDSIADGFGPLRKTGMRLALDDVGSRYEWLHHLLWLEPEFVKVDRAFVKDLHRHANKRRLLKGLCNLARHMGAQVVAEGIESEEERQVLHDMGVCFGQGFGLCPPLPVQECIWRFPLKGSDSGEGQNPADSVAEDISLNLTLKESME